MPAAMRWVKCAAMIGALISAALTSPALAAWPDRPIRIIAPSTPGGAADTFARIIAEYAGPKLGTTFIVDNRAGGGGLIGVAATAKAEPDGYSLVISSAAYNTIEPFVSANPGFDPRKDFTHIAYVGGQANTFLVSAKSPLRSLADAVASAKQKPMDFVSPGVGTLGHLLMENFASAAGIKLIRAGTVLPVAVSSEKRVEGYPTVPTLRELGYNLVADSWFGLSGPPGLPRDIVDKLNAAVADAMQRPEVLARLANDGVTVNAMSADAFTALVNDDIAKWEPIVRKVGLGH